MSIYTTIVENRKTAFIFVGLSAVSGVAWYACRRWRNQQRNSIPTAWEEVGVVSELLIYPVKSAQPLSVKSAEATINGLQDGLLLDRSFVIFNEDCRMVTGRESGVLVTLETKFTNSMLTITARNGSHVTVDLDDINNANCKRLKLKIRGDTVFGVDCGDEVARWLTGRLFEDGTKVRLLYTGMKQWKRNRRHYDFFQFPTFQENDTTSYNDTSSYNIMTDSSLADLNSRITLPVTMKHFRPPIVIGGTKPYDEDNWEYIKIGEKIVLHLSKPCHRCLLVTVDPTTGKRTTEHFEALKEYRLIKHPLVLAKTWATHPILGLSCGIDVTGRINVGDKVYVSRANPPYWHVDK